jgi:Flp pilus assembly protein TadG
MGGVRRRSPAREPGRRERGQGLVETAVLLPFFLLFIVGVIEVTNAMNTYVTLISSARDGARLGSKGLATDDEIKSLVVIETARLRDAPSLADVTVVHTTIDGEDAIRVTVCTDYTLLLSVPIVMPDNFTMCSSTSMREFPPQASN